MPLNDKTSISVVLTHIEYYLLEKQVLQSKDKSIIDQKALYEVAIQEYELKIGYAIMANLEKANIIESFVDARNVPMIRLKTEIVETLVIGASYFKPTLMTQSLDTKVSKHYMESSLTLDRDTGSIKHGDVVHAYIP